MINGGRKKRKMMLQFFLSFILIDLIWPLQPVKWVSNRIKTIKFVLFLSTQPKIYHFTAFMLCYTQDDANAEGGMYFCYEFIFSHSHTNTYTTNAKQKQKLKIYQKNNSFTTFIRRRRRKKQFKNSSLKKNDSSIHFINFSNPINFQ